MRSAFILHLPAQQSSAKVGQLRNFVVRQFPPTKQHSGSSHRDWTERHRAKHRLSGYGSSFGHFKSSVEIQLFIVMVGLEYMILFFVRLILYYMIVDSMLYCVMNVDLRGGTMNKKDFSILKNKKHLF